MSIYDEAVSMAKKAGFNPHHKVYDIILYMREEYKKNYVTKQKYERAREFSNKCSEELTLARKQVSAAKKQLKMLGITPDKRLFGEKKVVINGIEMSQHAEM